MFCWTFLFIEQMGKVVKNKEKTSAALIKEVVEGNRG